MAGAFVSIGYDDSDVLSVLSSLKAKLGDLRPAFDDIGAYLDRSHHERFLKEEAPDGVKWAPLSDTTTARKAKNDDRILIEEGHLLESLHYQSSSDGVQYGTDRIYGATHQFGAKAGDFGKTKSGSLIPWGDIPARPFLGISGEDRTEILDILGDFLSA